MYIYIHIVYTCIYIYTYDISSAMSGRSHWGWPMVLRLTQSGNLLRSDEQSCGEFTVSAGLCVKIP